MNDFNYHRPAKSADAVKLHQEGAADGKLMSGGMTLIPTMKQGLATAFRHRRSRRAEEYAALPFRAAKVTVKAGTTPCRSGRQ